VSLWREIIWTDENNREVARLACHQSELEVVLNRPFPPGAVVREPVYELTSIGVNTRFACRFPVKIGDSFTDNINQGDRFCRVVAVDEGTGDYLYEYEMPAGRTFLRNQYGKPVSRRRVPKKFRDEV